MAITDLATDLAGSGPADLRQLEADLAVAVDGEVRFDAGTRGAYSTDASNFRQVPIGVVLPRTVDAAVAAVAACRAHGVPLLSRGGGTSLAGQCTNTAVVIDWSKYCHRVLDIDAEARTCTVEPGIVLDVLNNEHLKPYGLRFGPEPATHMNCTLGGMIGNNSCGATAQRTGKVVDNIEALEVLLYDGTRFWCGPTSDEEYAAIERRGDKQARVYRRLRALRDRYADQIKATYPNIPRRVSGYNLDSLLPEHGFDVAGLLVGSESTLVTVLRARLKLVEVLPERSLVVLGYPSVDRAADAVPRILAQKHQPIALEGLDHRLITDEQIKHMNPQALKELPKGTAFLMVQFGGHTREEVDEAWRGLLALGVSGGLVPCPSAMVLLLAAVSLNRTAFGLVLVLAFSAGLALTLIGVGLAFLYARHKLPSGFAGGRAVRWLPAMSATAITGIGIALCYAAATSIL